jgi:hypothetical protein
VELTRGAGPIGNDHDGDMLHDKFFGRPGLNLSGRC